MLQANGWFAAISLQDDIQLARTVGPRKVACTTHSALTLTLSLCFSLALALDLTLSLYL